MKISKLLRFAFLGILALFVGGCACMHPKCTLVGRWENTNKLVVNFKADGTFDVDFNHDGKPDTWGTWSVSGDTLTIIDNNPKMPKACHDAGVYHFTRTGDTLAFRMLKADGCKDRKKNILLPWHAVKHAVK